jgi:uncharacterized protein YneF (UPF0154 family)
MNINVLIVIILLIFSFIVGYFFGKSKIKEKYENKRCFYCGHSEKENYVIK